MRLFAAAFAGFLLATAPPVSCQTPERAYETPPTPARVKSLVHARPFKVERPFINTASEARQKVSEGIFVVLEVDPAYVDPRDAVLNPVLYAGNTAVIRLNRGNESGHVIGIVPGDVDLATEPIWFGSPELLDRLTPATIEAERERAEGAGIRPFGAEKIAAVQQAPLEAPDMAALLRDFVAELVYEYSPQDKELADIWGLPVAGATSEDQDPKQSEEQNDVP